MKRKTYALGLDYGTNSCRSVLVDLTDGAEVASSVFPYPSGTAGVLCDPRDPNVARQNPSDWLSGLTHIVKAVLRDAKRTQQGFSADQIVGIGVDTTGCTPIPVDRTGAPLAFNNAFAHDLNAMAWLWKDHTSHAEAAEITELARAIRPEYLARCGGVYSSEWFWSKVLHCRRVAPAVFRAAHSFVECCDYLPAVLTGQTRPEELRRSTCAAGHKAMFADAWGGLPDAGFLSRLHPDLASLRSRLYEKTYTADLPAGTLCADWAKRLGLRPGIAVAVGAFDAHMGAVGAGIRQGTLVKILGTSTCDLMVMRNDRPLADIPGVCGIVDGSVLPGYFGIEAGQSAVGDIFLWFVGNLVPDRYGKTMDEKFAALSNAAAKQAPGAHGLLALDWNNGNRNILVDVRLSGLLVGQTLHTEAHEIYRALVEATAFGALTIIRRIEEYGVPVREIVNCGGIAVKNPFLMQVYADVTGRPMRISRSDQTCALGAALLGAVAAGPAAGGFRNVEAAQKSLCALRKTVYNPIPANHRIYRQLSDLYRELHDAFGTAQWDGKLNHVMKSLQDIRDRQRQISRSEKSIVFESRFMKIRTAD